MDAGSAVRSVFECGQCYMCCSNHLPPRHGPMLVRQEEIDVFSDALGVRYVGDVLFAQMAPDGACPFSLSPGCALEGKSERPLSCAFFPFFLVGDRVGVHLWCEKALELARQHVLGKLDLAPVRDELKVSKFQVDSSGFVALLTLELPGG